MTSFCFYVPRMAKKYNEGNVKDLFLQYNIGHVVRVENVTVGQSKYAIMDSGLFQKVYIYVSGLFDTPLANDIRIAMSNDESFKFHPAPNNTDECWTLMKNSNPVPETMLNIHQVAESVRAIEKEQTSFMTQMKHEMNVMAREFRFIRSRLNYIDQCFREVSERDSVRDDELDRIRQAIYHILPQLQIAGIMTEDDMTHYTNEILGHEECYSRVTPKLFANEAGYDSDDTEGLSYNNDDDSDEIHSVD